MFQRILIPTDGSTVARKAIDAGIRFAKEAGASVVGYYAVEPSVGIRMRWNIAFLSRPLEPVMRGARR